MEDRQEFLRKLAKAGVQWGHQRAAWNPKMAPYIWGFKNNVYLLDIAKTARQLEKASVFLKDVASQGKVILWVGTKKAAQEAIKKAGELTGMPAVHHRWIGGTLSNYSQVKKSVTKLLHFEDVLDRADKFPHYTKKELNTISKIAQRLRKNVGGITQLNWPIGAVVVVDVNKERSAVKEAARMGLPVVALVDTNGDPSLVNYVIPANDDAPRSVELLVAQLAEAAAQGKQLAAQKAIEKSEVEMAEDREVMLLEEDEEEADGRKSRKSESGGPAGGRAPGAKRARTDSDGSGARRSGRRSVGGARSKL